MPVMTGAEPFGFPGSAGTEIGVVLCHGFTGTPASMRPWGAALAAAGFEVSAPRLPGHGTSWQEANLTRWTDWYAELERAFDDMCARHSSVVVMGLSMGGTLTIRLAEQRPTEVAGIVVVNPSLLTLRKDAKLLPLAARIISSFPPIAGDIKKPGVPELGYDRLPVRAAASMAQLWKLARADLAQITAPVLLYRSEQDHVVEPASSVALIAGATSTTVEEHVLHDSYHVATLDNDAPEIFTGSIAFARSLVAGAVPGGGAP